LVPQGSLADHRRCFGKSRGLNLWSPGCARRRNLWSPGCARRRDLWSHSSRRSNLMARARERLDACRGDGAARISCAAGTPCRKCVDVAKQIEKDGFSDKCDHLQLLSSSMRENERVRKCRVIVVLAHENDPSSAGMLLGAKHNVRIQRCVPHRFPTGCSSCRSPSHRSF
jgi:hypothetical protein